MALGDKCSSGCKTKNHESWGQCLQAKNTTVLGVNHLLGDTTSARRVKEDVKAFRNAQRQGIKPDSSRRADVDRAVRVSETTGKAYQRGS